MMQIAKIMPVNFRAAAAQQPLVSKPSEERMQIVMYLQNILKIWRA